jgi:imidazolonepropionase-like amidohydrolase
MFRVVLLLATVWMMPGPAMDAADLAVRNVRIIHGDGRVTPRATVTVRGARIATITTGGGARGGPPARREVDAAGRTLMPGLIDAHVHVTEWSLPLFLRYGVTTVRDLHNAPAYILPLAQQDARDRPRIVAAGALLDGPGSFSRDARIVSTPAEARTAVREQAAAGAGVITVYTRLPAAIVGVIVQEARARGLPVAAHLGKTTAVGAARAGVTSIEHLSGVADAASDEPRRLPAAHEDYVGGWAIFAQEWARLDPARLDEVARALRASGIVLVPTLALHEAFSRLADPDLLRDPALAHVPPHVRERGWDPEDIMRRAGWTPETLREFGQALPVLQKFAARYVSMGGRVVAGTDTPRQFVVPGASLHRELQLYVAGGLAPAAALKTATADAADLLGLGDRVGTIDAGKDADLVLLDADPLVDITATMRVRLVLRGGSVVYER